jgi:hypothetical protein
MNSTKTLLKNIYLGIIIMSTFIGSKAFSQTYRNKFGIDFSKHNLMYQEPKDSLFKGNFKDYISYFDSEFIARLSYNLAQKNYELEQAGTIQNVSYSDCFIDFNVEEPTSNKKVKSQINNDSVYLGKITTRIICSVDGNPNKIFYCTNSSELRFSIFELNQNQEAANSNPADSLGTSYYFKHELLDSSDTKTLAISLAKSTSIKMDSIENAKYKLIQPNSASNSNYEDPYKPKTNFGPIIFKVALVIIALLIITH